MKDSGIEWIGEIPDDWEVYKNKELLISIYSGGTPKSDISEYYDVEGIPFITIADMSQGDYVNFTKIGLTAKGIRNKNLKILPAGTILYSIYATLGSISETRIPATINQAILALTPNYSICYKEYYKYNLVALKDYVVSEASKNTQSNLNAEKVKNFRMIVPPFDVQKKIANFLDEKCGLIDSICDKLRKEIEDLGSYRKSIITETVTKGLNPNVPMKDSGIEWIGEIPDDWEFNQGKYYLFDKKVIAGIRADEYERLSLTLNGVVPRAKDDNDGLQPKNFNSYQILNKGELVFKLIDLQNVATSRVGISDYTGIVSPAYITLHNKANIDMKFLYYFYMMMWYRRIFNTLGDASVRSNLVAKDLLEIKLPIPPLQEQTRIANFLDTINERLAESIKAKQTQLTELESYKKSLIYEYVTGKKRV